MKRTFRIYTAAFCITLVLIMSAALCVISYSHAKMLSFEATSPAFDSDVPRDQVTFTLFDHTFYFERYALQEAEAFLHQNILHVPAPFRWILWQKQALDALFSLFLSDS